MISHGYQHVVAMHHLRFTQNKQMFAPYRAMQAGPRGNQELNAKNSQKEYGNGKRTRKIGERAGSGATAESRDRWEAEVCVHSDSTAGPADPRRTARLRGLMCRRSCLHTEKKAENPLLPPQTPPDARLPVTLPSHPPTPTHRNSSSSSSCDRRGSTEQNRRTKQNTRQCSVQKWFVVYFIWIYAVEL